MAELTWDATGARLYETGTDRGVVYPYDTAQQGYGEGAAWNGLTGFTDSPSGADETALWADNIKYLSMRAAEEYGGTITAYTYPDEFEPCQGNYSNGGVIIGQQKRLSFAFSCRTLVGNDTELNDYGYKLHLVYGATVSPTDKDYETVNDSPDAVEMSWEFSTVPTAVGTGLKPTAHIAIDTTKLTGGTENADLKALEDILYGRTDPVYTLTTSEPADWETNYTSYYTKSGDVYSPVTGAEAPAWQASTYYKKYQAGPRMPMPAEVLDIMHVSVG